ncbi:hypothetical protein J1C67_05855 [Clostridium gasigenes]|uniref:hypothetical protein n=1 Tax=Clostridium gasigenes TaxID=94869 RepID=UPI001438321F|nr:hypothetical protein [Clostridium gasigenes]NKF07937.1 hypothetical protein [Clostridium gasigenes]QSW20686.1 hypothetical protein J1C67_05855 [Clostridium gasigenes]
MDCLRCNTEIKFLKEYRFDSQDSNRGLFKAIFDIEEHLVFDIYVCPKCKKAEFIYKNNLSGMESMMDM